MDTQWTGIPEISDRDMACEVLPDLDYEAQLVAISDVLRQHDAVDKGTTAQIKEVEDYPRKSIGLRNERAVDGWVDLLHGSTYQEPAHSMAALGMLAPLIESLFYQAYQGIRTTFYGVDVIPPGHARGGETEHPNPLEETGKTYTDFVASLFEAIDERGLGKVPAQSLAEKHDDIPSLFR